MCIRDRGRGVNPESESSKKEEFRSYLEHPQQAIDPESHPEANPVSNPDTTSEVISEGECPKVEVVSVDGNPSQIIIHLPDGRLLKLDCKY